MPVKRTPPRNKNVVKEDTLQVETNVNSAPIMSSSGNQLQDMNLNMNQDCMASDENNQGASNHPQEKEMSEVFGCLKKMVGRLDDSVFQPFGPSSRHNSENESLPDQDSVCRGGPGKKTCNEPVINGQLGVRCDMCLGWFHAACQRVTKPALNALDKFEEMGVCWLCNRCKPNVRQPTNEDKSCKVKLESLKEKMINMENILLRHMKLTERVLKEQEKNICDQTKLIERSMKMDQERKQTTFADIVKGSCNNIVKEVVTKLDTVKQANESRGILGQQKNEVAGILDSFLDKEQRKMNLVIHNMEESPGENVRDKAKQDAEKFKLMVQEGLRLVVHTTKCFRVGKKTEGKPRLLIVTLDDLDTKHEILRHARELRETQKYDNIYISPDLTKLEREQGKRMREELSRRRMAGEPDLVIWRGKIIKKTRQEGTETRHRQTAEVNNQMPVLSSQVPTPGPGNRTVTGETGAAEGGRGQAPDSARRGTGIFGDLSQHPGQPSSGESQMSTPLSNDN